MKSSASHPIQSCQTQSSTLRHHWPPLFQKLSVASWEGHKARGTVVPVISSQGLSMQWEPAMTEKGRGEKVPQMGNRMQWPRVFSPGGRLPLRILKNDFHIHQPMWKNEGSQWLIVLLLPDSYQTSIGVQQKHGREETHIQGCKLFRSQGGTIFNNNKKQINQNYNKISNRILRVL